MDVAQPEAGESIAAAMPTVSRPAPGAVRPLDRQRWEAAGESQRSTRRPRADPEVRAGLERRWDSGAGHRSLRAGLATTSRQGWTRTRRGAHDALSLHELYDELTRITADAHDYEAWLRESLVREVLGVVADGGAVPVRSRRAGDPSGAGGPAPGPLLPGR